MRNIYLLLCAIFSFLGSLSCTTTYVENKEAVLPIQSFEDKAVLVLVQPTKFDVPVDNYIDEEYVAVLYGRTYSVIYLEAGTHYLFAQCRHPTGMVRFNVEKGRVYYIGEFMYPNGLDAAMGFMAMTEEEFLKDFPLYSRVELLPEFMGSPYSGTGFYDWDSMRNRYEKKFQNDPESYTRFINMTGY